MSRTMQDLQNHLFAQLEKVSDEDLTDAELEEELERSKGITAISKVILESVELQIKAAEVFDSGLMKPKMLE